MEHGEFIDEEIDVETREFGYPARFRWRGRTFEVVEAELTRRVVDRKRAWWRRRHRDYFRVKTSEGRSFELYRHRGPGCPYWVLLRELGDPDRRG